MKIVVVGEMCKDIFVYGESNRLSPEGPVPVFLPYHSTENDGMAGNVVRNLLALDSKLKVSFFHQQNSIEKVRYIDEKTNHMFLRVDYNDKSDKFGLTEKIVDEVKNADGVIISDYDKGFLNESDIENVAKYSSFSIIDTKKRLLPSTIRNVSYIKLNESEYKKNIHIAEGNMEKILITKGINGTDYLGQNYPSPRPIQTCDVSGAGDTFTAAFTIQYLKTKDVSQSILYANHMASIVVSKRGVATP